MGNVKRQASERASEQRAQKYLLPFFIVIVVRTYVMERKRKEKKDVERASRAATSVLQTTKRMEYSICLLVTELVGI